MTKINHIYKMENFNMKYLKQNKTKNIKVINCIYCGQKSLLYNDKGICNSCEKIIVKRRKHYAICIISLITFVILLILF